MSQVADSLVISVVLTSNEDASWQMKVTKSETIRQVLKRLIQVARERDGMDWVGNGFKIYRDDRKTQINFEQKIGQLKIKNKDKLYLTVIDDIEKRIPLLCKLIAKWTREYRYIDPNLIKMIAF